MLKSQELPSSTGKNKPGKTTGAVAWKRRTAKLSRWLHIYVSMASFAIVFFFAVTGLTLNHADTFAGKLRTTNAKGTIDTAWVNTKDTMRIAKLEIVEWLRKKHNIKAAVSEFRIEDLQCSISFKGPGYAADAFIDRETGSYEIDINQAGFIGIMNDLHKGRDTGSSWSVVIDVSAILMTLVSLTGMILMLYIKRKRVSGLILAAAGLFLVWLVYSLWVK